MAQLRGRMLLPPQGMRRTVPLSSPAELKPPTNGRCGEAAFTPGPPEPVQRPLNTALKKQAFASTMIPIYGLFSMPKLYNHLLSSPKGGQSFLGTSLLWPPLPGKAIKLLVSPSPKTLSPPIWHQWTEAKAQPHLLTFTCAPLPSAGGRSLPN